MLVQLGVSPTSFEHVSCRITFSTYSCTIVVIYRTGAIYDCFFNDAFTTKTYWTRQPFWVRMSSSAETSISGSTVPRIFTHPPWLVFSDHGFIQCVDRPTHEKGGILDFVAVRSASPNQWSTRSKPASPIICCWTGRCLWGDPLPFIKLTCNDPGGISTWTTSSRLSTSPHFWLAIFAMLMGLRLHTKLSWDLFLVNWYLRDRQEFAFVLQIHGSMKIAARQKDRHVALRELPWEHPRTMIFLDGDSSAPRTENSPIVNEWISGETG